MALSRNLRMKLEGRRYCRCFSADETHSRDHAHFSTTEMEEENSQTLIGASGSKYTQKAPVFFRVRLKALKHPKFRPHAPISIHRRPPSLPPHLDKSLPQPIPPLCRDSYRQDG